MNVNDADVFVYFTLVCLWWWSTPHVTRAVRHKPADTHTPITLIISLCVCVCVRERVLPSQLNKIWLLLHYKKSKRTKI